MIAYNKTWLKNLEIHNQAQELTDAGCFTADELNVVKNTYQVGFTMPRLVMRVGAFILTTVCLLASIGLICLLTIDAHIIDSFGFSLFLGVCILLLNELAIREKKFYRAGVDDALLFMGTLCLVVSFGVAFTARYAANPNFSFICLSTAIAGILLILRYADRITTLLTVVAMLGTVFFFWQKIGSLGLATMPFMMMLAAAAIYYISLKLYNNPKVALYKECLMLAQLIALVAIYAAGNYLVVDTLNAQLVGNPSPRAITGIKWGVFFWVWTFAIPVIYLAFGIVKKKALHLRLGLVLLAAAIYTFRTYHHIMSIEAALVIGGALLLIVTYLLARYLKTPKNGFTIADVNQLETANGVKLEALLSAASFAHQPHGTGSKSRFGGGNFGGGGSGGKF